MDPNVKSSPFSSIHCKKCATQFCLPASVEVLMVAVVGKVVGNQQQGDIRMMP